MLTYTKNEIRKLAGAVVMRAMHNHNAYSYQNELTKCATDICNETLAGDCNSYSKEEMEAVITRVDSDIYDLLD